MNVKNKGAAGEREFCKWLFENTNIPMPQRELAQTRDGGADVIVERFYFEVKRQEQLNLHSWWIQVVTATKHNKKLVPIVAYRQNRKQWQFLISARHIGLKKGFIHLQANVFLKWFASQYLI